MAPGEEPFPRRMDRASGGEFGHRMASMGSGGKLSGGRERTNSFSVFVAPAPIVAGFERLHGGMFGRLKMRRGMFAWRAVATSYMPAGSADAQLHRFLSGLGAFFAGVRFRRGSLTLGQMPATFLVHSMSSAIFPLGAL